MNNYLVEVANNYGIGSNALREYSIMDAGAL